MLIVDRRNLLTLLLYVHGSNSISAKLSALGLPSRPKVEESHSSFFLLLAYKAIPMLRT